MGLEFWRVGQTSPLTIATDAPLLESQGWDGMVIADSQCVVGDSYVGLAIAARETSTLKLGVGVTNPITRHPAVTAAIIGPRTAEHLDGQLGAVDVTLAAALLDRIDEIVKPGTNFSVADTGYVPPGVAEASLRRRVGGGGQGGQ